MQIVGRTWLNLVTWTCGSWSEGQHDLYFTVQWFCLISWRQFDVCTSYFWSMNQYDPTFDLKIKCKSLWPIFHGDCALNLEDYCHVWTSLFGIMNQYDPTHDRKITKVTVTYISRLSDFALNLEDCLMYVHHTFGVWISMTQRLTSK